MADDLRIPVVNSLLSEGLANLGTAINPVVPTASPTTPVAPAGRVPTATPEELQEAVSFLSDPAALQVNAAEVRGGNRQSAVATELRTMGYGPLLLKYGQEVADARGRISQVGYDFGQNFTTDRTLIEKTRDAALGAASSYAGMAGSLAAFGLGAVSDTLGTAMVRGTDITTEAITGLQTQDLQDRRDADALLGALDARDSLAQYEEDVASGESPMVAGLRDIGRGITSRGERLYNDGALAGDVIANAIGSLGPSAKVASTAARLAQGTNAARLAVPLAIGVTEGAGAYSQTVSDVLSRPHEELLQTSPEYRSLILNGMDQDSARNQLANEAGLSAGLTQIPVATMIGMATGVSSFEAAPLAASSFREGLRNIGEQTIEEGLQGATGQVASNTAIQGTVDPTQVISEGVGSALAEGAVGGVGMTAITQSPAALSAGVRTAVPAVGAAAQAVGTAASAVGGAVVPAVQGVVAARNRQIDAGLDAEDPVGTPAVQEATTRVSETLPALTEAISRGATPEAPMSPEEDAFVTAANRTIRMTPEEVQATPEAVRNIGFTNLEEATASGSSRIEVLQRVANAISTGSVTGKQANTSILYLYDQVMGMRDLISGNMDPMIDSRDEGDSLRNALVQTRDDLTTILSNPIIDEVMQLAMSVDQNVRKSDNSSGVTPTETEVNSDTIQEDIALSTANPVGVNPDRIDVILQQSDEGRINLIPKVKKSLKAASTIAKTVFLIERTKQQIEAERQAQINAQPSNKGKPPIPERKTQDIVRQEIYVDGKPTKDKDRILPSLNDYYRDISGALQRGGFTRNKQGEEVTAQGQFNNLRNFAQSMSNKIDAINRSLSLNGPGKKSEDVTVKYRTWTGKRWLEATDKGASPVSLSLVSPNSVAFAQMALVDAHATIDLYNSLIDIYGDELVGEKLTKPIMDGKITAGMVIPDVFTPSFVGPKANPESGSETDPNREEPIVIEEDEPVAAPPGNSDDDQDVAPEEQEVTDARKELDELLTPPPKERKLRKDARLKRKESLIDYDDDFGSLDKVKLEKTRDQILAAIKKLGKNYGQGLINRFKKNRNLRIDPKGTAGQELRANDITPKTNVGLFRLNGLDELDNFVASEWEADFPGISEAAGVEGDYLSSQGMIDVITQSANGDYSWNYEYQELAVLEEDLEEVEQAIRALEQESEATPLSSEMADVGILLDLLGIEYSQERSTEIPSEADVRSAQETVLQTYEEFMSGNISLDDVRDRLKGTLSWFSVNSSEANADRVERAKKSATKRSPDNVEASYLVQLAEELLEVLDEITDTNSEEIEVQKRKLKVLRFGADTIIKQDGPYKGMTNQEAYELALKNSGQEELVPEPNLLKDGEVSRFTRAYAVSKGKSIFEKASQPLKKVLAALSDFTKAQSISKNQLKLVYDNQHLPALRALVETEVPALIKFLNGRIDTAMFNNNETVREALARRPEIIGFRSGKVLNLLDQTTGQYDERLLEIASMAALHWSMTAGKTAPKTYQDIADDYDIPLGSITEEMSNAANFGISMTRARESLAREILNFWGMDTNNNITMSDTRGIVEGLASEMLLALQEQKMSKLETFQIKKALIKEDGTKEIITVPQTMVTSDVEEFQKRVDKIGPLKNLLGMMVVGQNEAEASIGKPHDVVKKTQRRNGFSNTSKMEQDVLTNLQNIKFVRNSPFIGLLNAIGEFDLDSLRGGKDPNETKMNRRHAKSVEGINVSNKMSWKGVQDLDARVQNYAKGEGQNANEVGIYWPWYVTKVGRHGMDGFGPQADKLAREAFISTVATLDLTDPLDMERFWLTVAQSSGLVKTELITRRVAVERVQEGLEKKYGRALEAVIQWYDRTGGEGDMTVQERDALRADMGAKASPKLLHSLLAVARMSDAVATGGEAATKFQHMLSIEADGKTDGPINAMFHYAAGAFNQRFFNMVAKGGFYLNKIRTLNDHFEEDSGGDLYQIAAARFHELMVELRNGFRASAPQLKTPGDEYPIDVLDAMLRFMNHFGQIEFKNNEILIDRKVTKNPLTVTVYGAGTKGITGSIVGAITEEFYAYLTSVLQNNDEITEDYGREQLRSDLKTLFGLSSKDLSNIQNFEFSNDAYSKFFDIVDELLTTQMDQAIQEMMGETTATTKVMQLLTQVQAEVMIAKFKDRVEEVLQEQRDSGKIGKNEFLSQKDYDAIFKELEIYAAVIENDEQTVNLGTGEKGDSDHRFGNALDETNQSVSTLPQPSSAGVRASPYITISRGDAMMINNIYRGVNAIMKSLPVFDGVELAADIMEDASLQINKAVADAWLLNPVMDVMKSFDAFMRKDPLKGLSGATQKAIIKNLKMATKSEFKGDFTAAVRLIEQQHRELQRTAFQIEARKRALSEVFFSVDHMASTENTYVHEGIEITGDPIVFMNKLYEKHLKELRDEYTAPAIEKQDMALLTQLKKVGTAMKDHGSAFKTGSANVMKTLKDRMSKEQMEIYSAIESLVPKDLTFVFGSVTELTAYRNATYPERNDGKNISLGQIDLLNNVVYVTNASPETILHELVHATTMGKVKDYYDNRESLSEQDRGAIARLEILMNDFTDQTFNAKRDGDSLTEAANTALGQIIPLMNQGRTAEALNEFMAWTLTNQKLIKVNQDTRMKNPLARIGQKVLNLMGRLLGIKGDVWSNVLFNTQIILQTPRESVATPSEIMHQMGIRDQALLSLRNDFETKIATFIDTSEAKDPNSTAEVDSTLALGKGRDAADLFNQYGFPMTPQEAEVFSLVQAALGTQMELDNLAMVRSQEIYKHVMGKIDKEDFLSDPNTTDPAELARAQDQINVLRGVYGTNKDLAGNSNLLASFLALSQVNDQFRNILNGIDIPKTLNFDNISYDSFDGFLRSVTTASMNALSVTLTKEGGRNKTTQQALDNLTNVIAQVEGDTRTWVEVQYNGLLSTGDGLVSEAMERWGGMLGDWARTRELGATNRASKTLYQTLKLSSGILNTDRGTEVLRAATKLLNDEKVWAPVRQFMGEIVGMTDDNKGVYMLLNKVKYAVSAMRQDFRENLPKIFAEKFSRKLSAQEWSQLYSLGKVDIAVLLGTKSVSEIAELFRTPSQVLGEIVVLEKELVSVAPKATKTYIRKAKQLAENMVNGVHGHNLLTNAEAIARLLNEDVVADVYSERLVEVIDQLTTLYAVKALDQTTKNKLGDLARDESDGVDFLIYYLSGLRQKELSKSQSQVALLNGYKGYIPNETQDGVRLIIADDSEFKKLKKMGFVRKGDYRGMGQRSTSKKGYYYSTVAGRNTYSQGAMQTVQMAYQGVDPLTGRTLRGDTAGAITDSGYVSKLNQALKVGRLTQADFEEGLIPRFDENGNLSFFERGMKADMVRSMNRNSHLGEMMGAWRGRQAEEGVATEFNKTLVDRLKDVWVQAQANGEEKEFEDASSGSTKAIQEAWEVVPLDMRDYITQVFGADGFMVRRDMLENALGYRNLSVGDAFRDAESNPNDKLSQELVKASTLIFGAKAYQRLVVAENAIQTVVSTAKDIIVVRSVFVPVVNLLSNNLQLLTAGVPLRSMLRNQREKLVEINQFLRNLDRERAIEAELLTVAGDIRKTRILENELQSIKDSSNRMSIAPLIEAGLFSTISEGMTELDESLVNGKLIDWIEAQVNKVPDGAKTIVKNALLTRDTALYQGMSRAVQYGDFLAKATLYDHLTKAQGLDKTAAMERVSEEFVNYNFLPGQARSYAESMGLIWFWNFKIRSMKVAVRMVKNNPLRVLMVGLGSPVLPDFGLGSPIEDNFLSVWWQNRLGWSIGPEMAFRAPLLNPWLNLFR